MENWAHIACTKAVKFDLPYKEAEQMQNIDTFIVMS